ncbi:MAG TPA: universal stress protein [Acidimicrobiales bacterium]|nr:universal stress protein [Acidimicrobiales bacterium]
MFTTIVVGTDGSATAGAAMALAVQIARESGGTLHLVVGVKAPTSVSVPAAGVHVVDPSFGTHKSHAAQRMLEELAAGVEGIDVEIHTAVGDPADVIVRRADEIGADLIVVGSKGMRGTRRILGSVPNRVAHKAGCHVLIAKTA